MSAKALLLAFLALLSACNEMQYYSQSVTGHLEVVTQTSDIEKLLADENLDIQLREKLLLVLQAREFASDELDLSFNSSYTQYVDLKRPYVLQNLYAAKEFSTQLYSWCYPIIGCANYRGYFDLAMLAGYRERLDSEGYDTYVGNVTAYSTLGWFDDPVMNSFVAMPDYRLVGLIFHELAHQQIYVNGDTLFNESFATAVEQVGLQAFYAAGDDANQLGQYRAYRQRVSEVVRMGIQARESLAVLYRQPLSDDEKRQRKEHLLRELERRYSASLTGPPGQTGPVPPIVFNNARLGAMAAYHQYVPAFLNILESKQQNLPLFYAYVRQLSVLEPAQREACLMVWTDVKALKPPMPSTICPA